MNCEQALELMSARLDGTLSSEQEQSLQAHLEHCPECRRLMQTLSGLERQLAELREPAPAGLKECVLTRIRQAAEQDQPRRARWFGPGRSIGVVAALLVLMIGTGVFSRGRTDLQVSVRSIQKGLSNANEAIAQSPDEEEEGDLSQLGSLSGAPALQYADEAWSESVEASPEMTDNTSKASQTPVDETLRADCAALCGEEQAMVLLYSEFDYESLRALLEREAPELFKLLDQAEPTERGELLCCKTDCGTVLALHEWLMQALSEGDNNTGSEIKSSPLAISLEHLDPDCSSLHRVIRWTAGSKSILWPGQWPQGWAERLMQEENWALFFPEEDYAPAPGKTAYLVFP